MSGKRKGQAKFQESSSDDDSSSNESVPQRRFQNEDSDSDEYDDFEAGQGNDADSEEEEEEDDGDNNEEESEDEEEQAEGQLAEALKSTSFGELKALQRKIGTKKFEATVQPLLNNKPQSQKKGKLSEQELRKKRAIEKTREILQQHKPKLKKNAPLEISSKRRTQRFRQVTHVEKTKSRDPRYDSLCGNFNQDLFEKAYGFIEEKKEKEMTALLRELKKTKDVERKGEIQQIISKRKQEEHTKKMQQKKQALKREFRKKEAERVSEGKQPFYLKKAEAKKVELADKYRGLKESGKVDDFMTKRRKKVATKDHRYVPYKRD